MPKSGLGQMNVSRRFWRLRRKILRTKNTITMAAATMDTATIAPMAPPESPLLEVETFAAAPVGVASLVTVLVMDLVGWFTIFDALSGTGEVTAGAEVVREVAEVLLTLELEAELELAELELELAEVLEADDWDVDWADVDEALDCVEEVADTEATLRVV